MAALSPNAWIWWCGISCLPHGACQLSWTRVAGLSDGGEAPHASCPTSCQQGYRIGTPSFVTGTNLGTCPHSCISATTYCRPENATQDGCEAVVGVVCGEPVEIGKHSLGGALGGQMLSLIVDRLVEIDVEIRWEDIMREDDSSKVFTFHMNLDDDDKAGVKDVEESLSAADVTGPGCEAKHQHGAIAIQQVQNGALATLDEKTDKMDVMMDMTFEHLQMCVTNGHGNQVFEALIRSLQTTILETYKSKFTQFLVFYVCSLAPATCGNTFTSLHCDIFVSLTPGCALWPI